MAGKVNPTTLSWNHDGKNTDGSNFNPALFGGWELSLNALPVVSVPIGWVLSGTYTAPIDTLNLAVGNYDATLKLVTTEGIKSDASNVVQFEIKKVPSRPLAFSAV